MNQHDYPLFELLRGKVSIAAMDLIFDEKKKINNLFNHRSLCGHHLSTTCGLPCTCQLSGYLQAGQKVSVDEVDVFWRKLDFSPAYIIPDEKIDVREEMEKVTKHVLAQPESVQKSLLQKITSIVFPFKIDKKSPKVETNTRGRPRKQKAKETSVDPPRHSSVSFVPERQDIPIPSRHSISVLDWG
ncbi:hypothetical protein QVD17_16760 [Tagetes erecta]|uniref:Uncharacterized protein n=1 Tax=Tagetes erecta TaxID=13708 RepID=A0AAD8KVI0_TARER|nr:hypothetical protein QVD17_16760 [Tagetes erecta]